MEDLITRLLEAVKRFTVFDFAVFKVCLLALGILLGLYFSDFFANYISIVWFVFIITWIALIVQTIRYLKKNK